MIIYANSRKSGKTTEAIKLAASTHSVLVVANREMAHFVERQAEKMNYPVQAVSAEDFFNPRNRYGREKVSVVIDELDIVLRNLFKCEVIMATTTGCKLTINENEQPDSKTGNPTDDIREDWYDYDTRM